MLIGFDAKRAVCNMTGLGNYSREVIDVLSARRPGDDLRLYTPRMRFNPRLSPLLGRPNVQLATPAPGTRLPGLWRVYRGLTQDLVRDGVQLYHGLSGELPVDIARAGIPTVLTVHDVIFRRLPRCYAAIDRRIYDFKCRRSCQAATRVMAISECTKRDVMELYGVPEGKIDVVYQPCHPQFCRSGLDEAAQQMRLRHGRYVVAVGTVEERKNQMLAVNALPLLPQDVKLLIVGRRPGKYMAGVDDPRVVFLDDVPFADLPALYAGAELASYTSRYEGFGLPVVEAISCGTPVIAATGSCLEEAGGPGAVYVGPDDVRGYAEAANALLASPGRRLAMADKGRRHVSRFSPGSFADGIAACYGKALGRGVV